MKEPFLIIPVLDLKGGHVVHGRAGDRASYRPIQSPLVSGSEPEAVLDALLALAPFSSVYIADLDAIEKAGDHRPAIARLARRHAALEFWVDAGVTSAAAARDLAEAGLRPVLGSESFTDRDVLGHAMARLGAEVCILSLDYRGDRFIGPAGLDRAPELWPTRTIAMTLSRVGAGSGPDFARIEALRKIASDRRLYAAGGVRGREDLERLSDMGVAGVLVASALHDGRLDPADLRS